MTLLTACLIAYGPAKTEPESAWNIVFGVVAILVFAGALLFLWARGRRTAERARRESNPRPAD